MRVAVIGASGYTGLELLRILLRHPEFEIAVATSEQRAGTRVGDAFPSLRGLVELSFEPNDPASIAKRVDLAFTALPHAASAPTVQALRAAGVRVLDLSADFRLRDAETYRAWYGEHKAAELLGSAVYGLPEVYREALRGAELVAVPGCYPTSVLLPLVPFLRDGLIETDGIVVDSKSGVSGAGRKMEESLLFAELSDDCRAYKVGNQHRHVPEFEQEASAAAGKDVSITFLRPPPAADRSRDRHVGLRSPQGCARHRCRPRGARKRLRAGAIRARAAARRDAQPALGAGE